MPLLTALEPAQAAGTTKTLLDTVQRSLGMTPNLMRTLAHSPAALEGYLSFNGALAKGALSAPLREQLAIAIAEANRCEYCLSAHTLLGKMAKLEATEVAQTEPDSQWRNRAEFFWERELNYRLRNGHWEFDVLISEAERTYQ